ncbi:IS5 family transposase [Roseovarius autotrophicus]|uniref:IS5 family transposase n=1 Tax=Roseovarius autotrophicus TaxID=2824121 RepID=UPI001B36292A|nr:IS5 family transposase [Roseovarius autotrophicus]
MAQRFRTRPAASAKPRYRVTNWRDYNRALVERGSLTLWIDEEVLEGWRATGGKGWRYSDVAILAALSLRTAFRLTLRQTQGFLASLKQCLGLTIEVPHYSTYCRRAAGLEVPKLVRPAGGGPLHLAIDSTGLKVHGEGEWKIRMHGKDRRRVWRKLHLGVDIATGAIVAQALTPSQIHDAAELDDLLTAVDGSIAAVYVDKAYDSFDSHAAILARGARPVIPPRKGAAIRPPPGRPDVPPTRGAAVARIAEIGRKAWKKETHYHRRSLAETAMGRYKTIIGPSLKARTFDNQKAEAAIGARCLNRFTALGMPHSIRIA